MDIGVGGQQMDVKHEPARTAQGHKTVYVGNLSWDTTWQGLKDHMRQVGEVVHAEVFTEYSGRSAGCGIVEYETVEAADLAIQTLNDSVLDGRTIFVREDREGGKPRGGRMGGANSHIGGGGYGSNVIMNERGFETRRFGGHHGRGSDKGRKIVVWNLPFHIRWQDLKDIFRTYGSVIRADVLSYPDGKSKGMGTVLYETEEEANRAIEEMTGKEIDGRVIDCRLDRYA